MTADGSNGQYDAECGVFVEGLYEQYLENPESVSEGWRAHFSQMDASSYVSHEQVRKDLRLRIRNRPRPATSVSAKSSDVPAPADTQIALNRPTVNEEKQSVVIRLISNYRLYGHLEASTDPIGLRGETDLPDLNPEAEGLTEADMDRVFHTGTLAAPDHLPLREIIAILRETYTSSIGSEYMHMANVEQKGWLKSKLEGQRGRMAMNTERKLRLLKMLVAAEGLERYLHTRFSGQKRFSLEGGDALIAIMDELVQQAGRQGVKEMVIGMAHRGRLNMLINILGKDPDKLFSEFEGHIVELGDKMTGDVKYHQGFSSDVETAGGPVHLAMAFNPSHLEIINPVVEGSACARQERRGDTERRLVVPVLIHGDAAIAGQGVVYETIQLSDTRGYKTGGSVHIVINNQVGFTTSNPLDARTSMYCTDVGKVIQSPIFHVNGDDPEAVLFVVNLALEFRMIYRKDVFIDLICYRKHGHNEGDEPSVTQPIMYKKIRKHKSVADLYGARLQEEGTIDAKLLKTYKKDYRNALDRGDQVAPNILPDKDYTYLAKWEPYLKGSIHASVKTRLESVKRVRELGMQLTTVPEDFQLHKAVEKIFSDRRQMAAGDLPIDWGFAETLAYGSLVQDGYRIRISGQDSGRGTFFHRHAVIHDQFTGQSYCPLQELFPDQPRVTVIDSILSEEAVLGFEYGYCTTDPQTLTVWEAQYGDFANGAQVVVDQFISSSYQKWNLFNGLVMLLPHGWEGQGPEHSSARLERYLQLCAQENIVVVAPTTAAQMFHLLRRQMIRKMRLPLIVMSPKSMLRRKESFSDLKDLTRGGFQTMIGEVEELDPEKVERICLCSGKIYYELLASRKAAGLVNTALIRIEQLYPFPLEKLIEEFRRFSKAKVLVWAQEEPRNQGPWYQIRHNIVACRNEVWDREDDYHPIVYAGRIACAAPAGGNYQRHMEREKLLIDEALGLSEPQPENQVPKPGAKKSRKSVA
ncbi:MAG: 2-oxoglutarate dehydrogenase E1 component [Candidatus Omnitrophota bacterium]|jgi:2-oxoglutarate dehydrogenase E1 component